MIFTVNLDHLSIEKIVVLGNCDLCYFDHRYTFQRNYGDWSNYCIRDYEAKSVTCISIPSVVLHCYRLIVREAILEGVSNFVVLNKIAFLIKPNFARNLKRVIVSFFYHCWYLWCNNTLFCDFAFRFHLLFFPVYKFSCLVAVPALQSRSVFLLYEW